MTYLRRFFCLNFLFIILLAACNASPTANPTLSPTLTASFTATVSPTATITPSPEIHEKIDVGGYSLWIDCVGTGSPTVVLDAGLGDPGQNWTSLVPAIQAHTRVCNYSRAGRGRSDSALQTPRTSLDMAKDLHTLLSNAHVVGPYVLVCHSIAGYNVRVYADQYPQEVAGMVMIDCSHPDQASRTLALLPPETPDDPSGLKALRQFVAITWNDPHGNAETMDLVASAAQARAVGSLHDLPLVVLTANIQDTDGGIPESVAQSLQKDWVAMQDELAALSSNSTHIIAEKSRHFIHQDEPKLVIDAILKVVEMARKRGQ